jgi:hypothetical protein
LKLGKNFRSSSVLTNFKGFNLGKSLLPINNPSFWFFGSHYTRCKLGVINSNCPSKWSVLFFFWSFYSHWSWSLLWIIFPSSNMKFRSYNSFLKNRNCISRLCLTVGADKILRSYGNYKSCFCRSCDWDKNCSLRLGRICC